MVPFSLLLQETRDFSCIYYGNLFWPLGGESHNIVGAPPRPGPLGVFSSLSCLPWASSNSSIRVQVFLPRHGFPCWCLPGVSALVNSYPLNSPFGSLIWGEVVCLMPFPVLWIQEELLIFSLFSLLLGPSDSFQVSYMLNWKTCIWFFILTTSWQGQCDSAPCGVIFQDGSLTQLANWYLAGDASQWHLTCQVSWLPLHVVSLNFSIARWSRIVRCHAFWLSSRRVQKQTLQKLLFLCLDHFLSLSWICYKIASVLCCGFLAMRHVGS